MRPLRDFTPARVELGRAGHSLPTAELLRFQLAHARARDAVHLALDVQSMLTELARFGLPVVAVASAAGDRTTYLRRPDLGRRLDEASRRELTERRSQYDAAFVIADGLSALAVHRHASAVLEHVLPELDWRIAPLTVASQGRVGIGDEIGEALGAGVVVVLIGERPGLSSPDSLGIYLTWAPKPGRTEAERNCISNVRADGLSYRHAAHKLLFLMHEARRRKLSGVDLKETAGPLLR